MVELFLFAGKPPFLDTLRFINNSVSAIGWGSDLFHFDGNTADFYEDNTVVDCCSFSVGPQIVVYVSQDVGLAVYDHLLGVCSLVEYYIRLTGSDSPAITCLLSAQPCLTIDAVLLRTGVYASITVLENYTLNSTNIANHLVHLHTPADAGARSTLGFHPSTVDDLFTVESGHLELHNLTIYFGSLDSGAFVVLIGRGRVVVRYSLVTRPEGDVSGSSYSFLKAFDGTVMVDGSNFTSVSISDPSSPLFAAFASTSFSIQNSLFTNPHPHPYSPYTAEFGLGTAWSEGSSKCGAGRANCLCLLLHHHIFFFVFSSTPTCFCIRLPLSPRRSARAWGWIAGGEVVCDESIQSIRAVYDSTVFFFFNICQNLYIPPQSPFVFT